MSRLYRWLADAHRYFANRHSSRQDYLLAIANYTRALAHDPTCAQAYFSRGVLYWREVGEPERAIQDLTHVLELDASWAEAYFNRAIAHRMRQEREQAAADFSSYLAIGTDDYWLGSAQRQLAELQQEMDELGAADGETPR